MPKPKPDLKDRQERLVRLDELEYREAEDGKASISGYASVFNEETVIAGFFREQIAPGAFDDALGRDDVRALFNHDPNVLLGRTSNKTLRLSTDDKGLRYDVDLPNTAAARDVRELIRGGYVDGSSFGFVVEEDDWDESEVKKGKLPLRTIRKVSLFDVSPVTFPAYTQTSVSARSKAEAITEAETRAKAQAEAAKSDEVKAREAARASVQQARKWQTIS